MNILLCTDFSEASRGATAAATALAQRTGGQLHLMHVVHGKESDDPETAFARLEDEANRIACPDLPRVIKVLAEGDPAQAICEHARKSQTSVIVVGTHGRTGLAHLVRGSVAEHVLRHAPCPVLSVRPGTIPAAAQG